MTPNHRILTRAHFAEASALFGEGHLGPARMRLRLSATHALSELAASHGVAPSTDPAATADRLAELGELPHDVGPLLRHLNATDRLEPAFATVQELIDVALDMPGTAAPDEPAPVGAPTASTSTVEAPAVAMAHRVPEALTRPPRRQPNLLVAFAVMLVSVSLLAGAICLAAGGSSEPAQPRTAGEVPTVR